MDADTPPQWDLITDFVSRAKADQPEATAPVTAAAEIDSDPIQPIAPRAEPKRMPQSVTPTEKPAPVSVSTRPTLAASIADDDCNVADLPNGEVTEMAVVSAVIGQARAGLIECPIHPPMCPQATLAVSRDRRLVLLAVARKGLGELRAIAQAYRWVIENRPLLSMALPQFSIDTHALPSLQLIVDHADSQADLLLPMNENSNISVQTYRKLKWAGRTGLLLEAA